MFAIVNTWANKRLRREVAWALATGRVVSASERDVANYVSTTDFSAGLLLRFFLKQSHHAAGRILAAIALAGKSFQQARRHPFHIRDEFRVGRGSFDVKRDSHAAERGIHFEREFVGRTHGAGAGEHAERRHVEIDVV